MTNIYDTQNVFAKILRQEIPAKILDQDKHTLVFHDAFPKAKQHVLIIPKKAYTSFQDFSEKAPEEEVISLIRMISKVAKTLKVDASGYRILSNHGKDASQEVPHFHIHLCGGQPLGPIISLST